MTNDVSGVSEVGAQVVSEEGAVADGSSESKSRWVLAFDPESGIRVGATVCPVGQVPTRKMLYEMDGYRVEVMTDSEIDDYIAAGGK